MTKTMFPGPRAKLRAVRRHGKTFREEFNRYIAQNKRTGIKQRVDPPSTATTLYASLTPVPEDLCVIVGEMAYQLRSSLDLLACDLAKFSGATSINDVYFPIARTKEGYFDKRSLQKTKKLRPELRAAIDDLKPYGDSILVAINAVAGTDRHRDLLDVFPSIKDVDFAAYGTRDFKSLILQYRKPSPNERGEIPVLTVPSGTPIDVLHLKLQCRVVFAIEPIVGKPVPETLSNMGRTVEGIINSFETLCARL